MPEHLTDHEGLESVYLQGLDLDACSKGLFAATALSSTCIKNTKAFSMHLALIYVQTYTFSYSHKPTQSSISELTHRCCSSVLCVIDFRSSSQGFPSRWFIFTHQTEPLRPGGGIHNAHTHTSTQTIQPHNVSSDPPLTSESKICFGSVASCTLHHVLPPHICNQLQQLGAIVASFAAACVRISLIKTSNIPSRGPG